MTVFIFRSALMLACIQWLYAQKFYGKFMPEFRQLQQNEGLSPLAKVPPSKDSTKNINSNKNVNVILNVNSEEVAQSLWQIIQENLSREPNKLSWVTQQQIKEAILPIVSTTRRGFVTVPITQIGDQLEKITRRALTKDAPDRSAVDREILTRGIVANMMSTLKNVVPNGQKLTDYIPSRRMLIDGPPIKIPAIDNAYVTFQIKVQRRDISKVIHSMM